MDEELEAQLAKAIRDIGEGIFSATATNGSISSDAEPITLERLVKMKDELYAKFPSKGIKYKHGVDMSIETFTLLKIVINLNGYIKEIDRGKRIVISPESFSLSHIEIHLIPGLPFGKVEECRCAERKRNG